MFSVVHLNKTDYLHGHIGLIRHRTRERHIPQITCLRITDGHVDVSDISQPMPVLTEKLCIVMSVEDLPTETCYFSSALFRRVKKDAAAYSETILLVSSSFSKMKSVTALSVIFFSSVS